MYTTPTLPLNTTRKIPIQSRTHALQALTRNPSRICITLTLITVQCALEIGIGIKGPKNPRRVSDNYSTLSVNLPFLLPLFHRPCGVTLTHSLGTISLMVTFQNGWVRTMGGNAPPLQYWYHFMPSQEVQEQKTTQSMAFITVPSSQSSGKRSQIQFTHHFSTLSHMNYDGTHLTRTTISRSMVSCLRPPHFLRHTRCFKTHPQNLVVICPMLSWHSCSGPTRHN